MSTHNPQFCTDDFESFCRNISSVGYLIRDPLKIQAKFLSILLEMNHYTSEQHFSFK